MFCKQCGAKLSDDVRFCNACGALVTPQQGDSPLQQPQQGGNQPQYDGQQQYYVPNGYAPYPQAPAKKKLDKKTLLFGGVGLAVIAIAVVLILLLSGGGYKGAIKTYEKLLNTYDVKYAKQIIPEELVNAICEDKDISKAKFWADMKSELEDNRDYIKERVSKYSVKIRLVENKKMDGDALKDFKADLKDELFDEYELSVSGVTEAYEVTITVKLVYDDEEQSETLDGVVFKYNGKWYVYDALWDFDI